MNCKNCGARLPINGQCEYCGSYDKEADYTSSKSGAYETIDDVLKHTCPNCGGLPIILTTDFLEDMSWGVMCKCDTCGKHSALYKVNQIDINEPILVARVQATVNAFQDFLHGRFSEPSATILYADGREFAKIPDELTKMIEKGILTPSAYRDLIFKPKEWKACAGIIPRQLRQFQNTPSPADMVDLQLKLDAQYASIREMMELNGF